MRSQGLFARHGMKAFATQPWSKKTGDKARQSLTLGVTRSQSKSVAQIIAKWFQVKDGRFLCFKYRIVAQTLFLNPIFYLTGTEECHEVTIPSTQVTPTEICDLQPTADCHVVTSMVPYLAQSQNCEEIPKEFCHMRMGPPVRGKLSCSTSNFCYLWFHLMKNCKNI